MQEVTIVVNDKMGGVPNVFINMVKYMEEEGLKVSFLLLHQLEDKQEGIHAVLQKLGIEVHKIVYSKLDNKYYLYQKVARYLEQSKAIIANDYRELEAYYLHQLHQPLLYVIHGDEPAEYQKMRQFAPIIDKFVCVSQFITDQLKELLPERKEDVVYIPQPIPDYSGNKIRKREKILRLVYIGRFTTLKGEEELIGITDSLWKSRVNVSWKFISNGINELQFKRRLPKNLDVKFFSDISNGEVYDALLESDVLVFPSHREGFPLVVVEAMKCGVVPVVSDLETGIPEIVYNGTTGFRIAIGDVTGFVEKIKFLNLDRETLDKMSENSKEMVSTKFTPSLRAKDYTKTIVSLHYQQKRKVSKKEINTSLTGMDKPIFPNILVRIIRKFRQN